MERFVARPVGASCKVEKGKGTQDGKTRSDIRTSSAARSPSLAMFEIWICSTRIAASWLRDGNRIPLRRFLFN